MKYLETQGRLVDQSVFVEVCIQGNLQTVSLVLVQRLLVVASLADYQSVADLTVTSAAVAVAVIRLSAAVFAALLFFAVVAAPFPIISVAADVAFVVVSVVAAAAVEVQYFVVDWLAVTGFLLAVAAVIGPAQAAAVDPAEFQTVFPEVVVPCFSVATLNFVASSVPLHVVCSVLQSEKPRKLCQSWEPWIEGHMTGHVTLDQTASPRFQH